MIDYTNLLDEALTKFNNTNERAKKKPRYYGCDELIYQSDIHMIEAIGKNLEANTTELAEILGVAKSLVSRQTKKLEMKGYIRKYQYQDNKKEIYYKLTDLGKKAYHGHEEFHKMRNNDVYKDFERYSEEQKQFLIEFITKYTEHLKQYI